MPYRTANPAEGRVAVTGRDADRFNFKVPTIRNVALTYPYFHDGAAETLGEAVEVMGQVQLGRTFTADENARIVAFLNTLTGEQPHLPAAAAAAVVGPDASTAAVCAFAPVGLAVSAGGQTPGSDPRAFEAVCCQCLRGWLQESALLEMQFVAGIAGRAHLVERRTGRSQVAGL